MNVMVIGGTGTVGREVVKGLLARRENVSVLIRSAERAKLLPQGATPVVGDLMRPDSLTRLMAGTNAVFLLTAMTQDETRQGQGGVRAAKGARADRIVYLSVPMPPGSTHIPHFASKIPIEQAIKHSGLSYTILRSNHFFQNDLAMRDAILTYGIYPAPIGDIGLSRVDVRDVADAAVTSLLDTGHDGKDYALHGPDDLNGEKIAEILSRRIGQGVRYIGNDLNIWGRQVRDILPEWMIKDLQVMFKYFQEHGFRGTDAERATARRMVGHDLRTFDQFASEIAAVWRAEGRVQTT
jgi:uncharacterized protein YbjT (DUF2867 family)